MNFLAESKPLLISIFFSFFKCSWPDTYAQVNYSRQKKLNDDDIAICECKYISGDPESACGERCLNVLTSTECTPGYCPCGNYCKNQVCVFVKHVLQSLYLSFPSYRKHVLVHGY